MNAIKAIPFIPENAPFTPVQRQWLNGYLAGYFSNAALGAEPVGALAAPPAPPKPLAILYGTQTGTAELLAKKAAKAAAARGFAPSVLSMEKHSSANLPTAQNALIITSTYGDGEPPENAHEFWAWLTAEETPDLAALRFSVLALGDTNYPAFCQFGKDCDLHLERLGGRRAHPRMDCDLEYDAPFAAWLDSALAALSIPEGAGAEESAATEQPAGSVMTGDPAPPAAVLPYGRKNPFPARLVANRLLNAEGSAKEVRHFEISLEGSGLEYQTGDALGVLPSNCPALVSDLLAALGCDGEEAVADAQGAEISLRQALLQQYDILKPSGDFLKAAAEKSAAESPFRQLIQDPARKAELKPWLWGREIIDVLAEMDSKFSPAEFVALLKKLQPRLYSISSSPKAHPGQVHLTVGAVRYESHGRQRKGVCSTFLADRAGDATPVPVFVQPAHGFRLPADGTLPVIMVGPGTGIAPFRAFLEERRASAATGKNWLFFGDQRAATDYLYRDEIEAMRADGHLTRLDLAFSRDQKEKIYVQHRMLAAAAELWAWLQEGAHFYVCGDASRMAKDVDAALHQIAVTAGGLSTEGAAEYIASLKAAKRYQRDVY